MAYVIGPRLLVINILSFFFDFLRFLCFWYLSLTNVFFLLRWLFNIIKRVFSVVWTSASLNDRFKLWLLDFIWFIGFGGLLGWFLKYEKLDNELGVVCSFKCFANGCHKVSVILYLYSDSLTRYHICEVECLVRLDFFLLGVDTEMHFLYLTGHLLKHLAWLWNTITFVICTPEVKYCL